MDALELMHRHEAEQRLAAFVAESNRIEGIHREPSPEEIGAHRTLVGRKKVKVEHVTQLVAVCQPNAVLRATADIHGVRVGNHVAPPSGPKIVEAFDLLLEQIANGALTPWAAHVKYETLHPYTDGNGRSGRAVWLWQMTLLGQQQRVLAIGFLLTFYYQTLAASQ
jgi:hypothetical protein